MSATFVDDYIDGYQVSYTAMTDVTDLVMQQREQSVTYDNLPGLWLNAGSGRTWK